MMSEGQFCKHCAFVKEHTDEKVAPWYTCRRFPPNIPTRDNARQPYVPDEGWCGEWKKKPEQ